MPDQERVPYYFRVNPRVPISPEVTAIHGITDADVAESPSFEDVARDIETALEGCDLGGYNVLRYDIPLLEEESLRAKIRFSVEDRRVRTAATVAARSAPSRTRWGPSVGRISRYWSKPMVLR